MFDIDNFTLIYLTLKGAHQSSHMDVNLQICLQICVWEGFILLHCFDDSLEAQGPREVG